MNYCSGQNLRTLVVHFERELQLATNPQHQSPPSIAHRNYLPTYLTGVDKFCGGEDEGVGLMDES